MNVSAAPQDVVDSGPQDPIEQADRAIADISKKGEAFGARPRCRRYLSAAALAKCYPRSPSPTCGRIDGAAMRTGRPASPVEDRHRAASEISGARPQPPDLVFGIGSLAQSLTEFFRSEARRVAGDVVRAEVVLHRASSDENAMVGGEREIHHSIPDDYVRCPDLGPILSLEPFLSRQFGKELGADGAVIGGGVGRRVAFCHRQGPHEVRPADDAHELASPRTGTRLVFLVSSSIAHWRAQSSR